MHGLRATFATSLPWQLSGCSVLGSAGCHPYSSCALLQDACLTFTGLAHMHLDTWSWTRPLGTGTGAASICKQQRNTGIRLAGGTSACGRRTQCMLSTAISRSQAQDLVRYLYRQPCSNKASQLPASNGDSVALVAIRACCFERCAAELEATITASLLSLMGSSSWIVSSQCRLGLLRCAGGP
jgi:hypothetical protein